MNIIIFIIILGVLIFVHELGHFLFAKLFGVRVDEFGFGYPPKAIKIGQWKETEITINWIPFGGFVRLFGEADTGEALSEEDKEVSLVYKPRWQQFLVMFGGILFNIIFGWMLLSLTYMGGIQAPVSTAPANYNFTETELTVTSVIPDTPAFESGLQAGDVILEYGSDEQEITVVDNTTEQFSDFINDAGVTEDDVYIVVNRNGAIELFEMKPSEGVVADRYGIGIGLDRVGELQLGFFQALGYGAKNTINFLGAIIIGFGQLISGQIPLDAVSGPVGIVGQVGDASAIGLTYLIGFTAILSLNLAVLNAFPFPALDGGKIVIVIIESIIKRRLPTNAVNWVNAIGFILLIVLMIIITIKDIINIL
jgi:regulator of sigma E protease